MAQILAKLSRSFNAEMPASIFDYFSFERRCYDAVLQIRVNTRLLLLRRKAASKDELQPFDNTVSLTSKLFCAAIKSERMMQAVSSKNRTAEKAYGPAMARQIRVMLPQTENNESKAASEQALSLLRAGRLDEVVRKIADTVKHVSNHFTLHFSSIVRPGGRE
jgi:hypothetical protein